MDLNKFYTINVLGTAYTIEFENENSDKLLKKCDGYCDKTSKKLVIDSKDIDCDLDKPMLHLTKCIRHEVIHAFMHESGLAENWEHKNYGQEETTVDWFAHQLPKINNALKDAGLTECI